MEAKERLAARLEELNQNWNQAETDELVHLVRDLYEGLVELRYQEQLAPQPSSRSEPVKSFEPEEEFEFGREFSSELEEENLRLASLKRESSDLPDQSEEPFPSSPLEGEAESPVISSPQPTEQHSETAPPNPPREPSEQPAASSPRPTAKSQSKILIDFNDRWAFVNKLFDRNQDDFNRVISQLNTMSTYTEARNFIEHVVKPDYHWSDQEEFETRFMELIERHFS